MRDCWTRAALKLQSEHCNVVKGPNFNFQFVVPCLVLISSELRALSLSPNLNLQFEKACIALRSSSILCEVWSGRRYMAAALLGDGHAAWHLATSAEAVDRGLAMHFSVSVIGIVILT